MLGRRPRLREERRQVGEDPLGLADRGRDDDEREPDDRHEEREVDDEDRAGTPHDRQPLPEPAEDRFERGGEQDGDEDEQEDAGGRNPDQDERVDEGHAQREAHPPNSPQRNLGPHVTGCLLAGSTSPLRIADAPMHARRSAGRQRIPTALLIGQRAR